MDALVIFKRIAMCREIGFPEQEYLEWAAHLDPLHRPARETAYYSMDAQMYHHFTFANEEAVAIFKLRWL